MTAMTTTDLVTRVNDALTFDMSRADDDDLYLALVLDQLECLFDELDTMLADNDDPTLCLAQRAVSLAFTFIETTGSLPANVESE
ncbi:hypothetical protein ACTXG5_08315 [Mycobacterium sp. Dal123C01]|uniref:hypothetical protein n=1 Tax=Mycobacterium sp. Dal123C01 TaxID=3457577 RepID=UPI00403E981A